MPQDIASGFGSSSVGLARFIPLARAQFGATLAGLLVLTAAISINLGCEKRALPHQVDDTRIALGKAARTIEQYRVDHNALPSTPQGQLLVAELHDGWGRSFQYRLSEDGRDYDLRSAGVDGLFGNFDDIAVEKPDETVPTTNPATITPGEAFNLSLTAEGTAKVDGKTLTDEELIGRLREWSVSHPGGPVLIDYSKATPDDRIVQVYEICGKLKLVPAHAPLKLPTTLPVR